MPQPAAPPDAASLKVAEMLGLVRGVVADGVVNEAEARALREWLEWHSDIADVWPVNVLARRIQGIFRDGRVDPDEREDLATLLARIVEGTLGPPLRVFRARDLPLSDPEPAVTFRERVFTFAGRFASGTTASRDRAVVELGGRCEADVTSRTDYLVVGAFGGDDWRSAPGAELIRRATEVRGAGGRVAIVSEEHWWRCLARERAAAAGEGGAPGDPRDVLLP